MAQDAFTAARHFTPLLLLALTAAVAPVPSSTAQCTDADLDGFFHEAGCGTAQDCNDAAPTTYPGALEVCDGFDNDCNQQIDDDPACDRSCDLPHKDVDEIHLGSGSPQIVWTGTEYAVVWVSVYIAIASLLTLFSVMMLTETYKTDLHDTA